MVLALFGMLEFCMFMIMLSVTPRKHCPVPSDQSRLIQPKFTLHSIDLRGDCIPQFGYIFALELSGCVIVRGGDVMDHDLRDVNIWSLVGSACYARTFVGKTFVRGEANVRIPSFSWIIGQIKIA